MVERKLQVLGVAEDYVTCVMSTYLSILITHYGFPIFGLEIARTRIAPFVNHHHSKLRDGQAIVASLLVGCHPIDQAETLLLFALETWRSLGSIQYRQMLLRR